MIGTTIRIIPRLDIKGHDLVKGVHLEGLRVLGRPEQFARTYYEQGADELFYMDVVASLYQRNSLLDLVSRTSREIFIPLTVGGGLRSVEDIRAVLHAGADKVSLNTAAIGRPELIREVARRFGSSTIVVSIEAIKKRNGGYEAMTDHGRQPTGRDAVEWARQASELGAGEIAIMSIDREGTGKGFDLELTRSIAAAVPVPVIACGGAGAPDHVHAAVVTGQADGVCIASIFHYHLIQQRANQAQLSGEGNTDYLKSRRPVSHLRCASVQEIKNHLIGLGILCRRPLAKAVHA
jgi:cyclase